MRPNRCIGDAEWRALRLQALERDKWTCGDCGRRGARFECHHVNFDPADNRLENLVILCRSCHQLRHYRPVPAGRADWDHYLDNLTA